MTKHLPSEIKTKFDKIYHLRSFDLEDALSLQRFYSQIAEETTNTMHHKEKAISLQALSDRIKQTSESILDAYLGVFDKDKIIAVLYFRVPLPDHPWVKHIAEFGIMVLEEHSNCGIGSKLLEKMENFAISSGITKIEAKVRTSNEHAKALYKKFGYEIEGLRKNAAFINGQYEDELYVAKIFK